MSIVTPAPPISVFVTWHFRCMNFTAGSFVLGTVVGGWVSVYACS